MLFDGVGVEVGILLREYYREIAKVRDTNDDLWAKDLGYKAILI